MVRILFFFLQCVLFLQCGQLFAQSIYEQDFERGMPDDFILINADGLMPAQEVDSLFIDSAWIVVGSELLGSNSNVAMSLSWYENDGGPADDWMVLPQMVFGGQGKLVWRAISTTFGEYPDSYEVLFVEETPSADNVASLETELILRVENESYIAPVAHAVDISGLESRRGHIVFRNITPSGDALLIDDISITDVEWNPTNIQKVDNEVFDLQLFPNPTSSQSTLQYELNTPSNVTLSLQNTMGQVVWELKQGQQNAGIYQLPLAAKELPRGMYWLKLQNGKEYTVRKWMVE
ncbi:MAG: T9SS type A sorting domain-containing protein [Chitinophagales bacterium]